MSLETITKGGDEMNSILTSIKKLLGITGEYEAFDVDIIMHINMVFMTLNQMGVGPESVFNIIDKNDTWEDFLPPDDKNFSPVKTYVYLKVKMVFDPPSSSIVMEAMNRMVSELEWRMNSQVEIN